MSTGDAEKLSLIKPSVNRMASANDADIFFYNSEIRRPFDSEIIRKTKARRKRKNIVLILVTEGGDPDATYGIARCFQEEYEKFTCLIPGFCKSAGTLLATGAHELVMSDNGELGPLDVQMSKRDDLFESESGLTVTSALEALYQKAFLAFEHFFLTINVKSKNRVTLKTATEIAAKLTSGLFAPIFQQVDPIHVGEAYRATAVASHYAARLAFYGKNISDKSLERLISGYPQHGFVIDRSEADGLFIEVREPNTEEEQLISMIGDCASDPVEKEQYIREFLSDEREADDVRAQESPTIPDSGKSDGEALRTTIESVERQGLSGRSPTATPEA